MDEKLIKSADRVKDHGEVFTPKRIVDLMLDQPEIMAKINDLSATFLEPSAGEGAFLVELLRRKLAVAAEQSTSADLFHDNSLLALSTLYGIEYLKDNYLILVTNMINTFGDEYARLAKEKFSVEPVENVVKSAGVIIRANMVQGDTLKKVRPDGSPIIFSEWTPVRGKNSKRLVQRTEYTFESIIDEAGPVDQVQEHVEEMDLFADFFQDEEKPELKLHKFAPCSWRMVFEEKIE